MADEKETTEEPTADEQFNEAFNEAVGKEDAADTDKSEETDDTTEDQETDKETEDQEEAEKDKEKEGSEKEEEIDWKAEAEKAKKQAEDNKKYGDDLARQLAEKKKSEAEQKKKEEDAEADAEPPAEVVDFLDEFPGADKTINFFIGKAIKKAVGDYDNEITEACGGQKLPEFIQNMVEYRDRVEFERVVMLGYYDDSGKYISGHPDVLSITRSQTFKDWIDMKIKTDPRFDPNSNNPIEAIKILDSYKDDQLEAANKKKGEATKKKKEELEEQTTSTAQSDVSKKKTSAPDAQDFNAAWNEANKPKS